MARDAVMVKKMRDDGAAAACWMISLVTSS